MQRADLEDPRAESSSSVIAQALARGEPVVLRDAVGSGAFTEQDSVQPLRLRSVLCCPVRRRGVNLGFVYLDNAAPGRFDDATLALLSGFLEQAAELLDARLGGASLEGALLPGLPTRSEALRSTLAWLLRQAPGEAPLLIWGAAGTGKVGVGRTCASVPPERYFPLVECPPVDTRSAEAIARRRRAKRRCWGRWEPMVAATPQAAAPGGPLGRRCRAVGLGGDGEAWEPTPSRWRRRDRAGEGAASEQGWPPSPRP